MYVHVRIPLMVCVPIFIHTRDSTKNTHEFTHTHTHSLAGQLLQEHWFDYHICCAGHCNFCHHCWRWPLCPVDCKSPIFSPHSLPSHSHTHTHTLQIGVIYELNFIQRYIHIHHCTYAFIIRPYILLLLLYHYCITIFNHHLLCCVVSRSEL